MNEAISSAPVRTAGAQRVTTRLAWDDGFALGEERMDQTHRDFVHCVDALLTSDDEALEAALAAFEQHARAHFAEEEEAMRVSRYDSARCHVDEHAAVLESLRQVKVAQAQGRTEVVRAFAVALADWFPGHTDVMDKGLASWLARQRWGGSPIAISRAGASCSPSHTAHRTSL